MRGKPSLKAKKNIQVVYCFAIPTGDFCNTIINKEDTISALIDEYSPLYISRPFGKVIFCYETEQQCLDAYDAFHKQIHSATYMGRGEVYD